jgi:hypothetical protein
MVHQFAQGPEGPQLILSMEPGDCRLSYSGKLPFVFGMLRVLSGSLTIESQAGRIENNEKPV